MKKYIVHAFILSVAIVSPAQELLRIDITNHLPQRALRPIIKAFGSISVGGIIDGEFAVSPLVLSIGDIKSLLGTGQIGSAESVFEIRLTYQGNQHVILPIDPSRDKIIDECGKSAILQSHLSINVIEDSSHTYPPITSDLFGCNKHDGSGFITLRHGEWITYTGHISIAASDLSTHNLTASWLLADVNYTEVPDGLVENAKTRITLTAVGRKAR